ncbi:hypothetical protein D9M71_436830 [compost metagenome]
MLEPGRPGLDCFIQRTLHFEQLLRCLGRLCIVTTGHCFELIIDRLTDAIELRRIGFKLATSLLKFRLHLAHGTDNRVTLPFRTGKDVIDDLNNVLRISRLGALHGLLEQRKRLIIASLHRRCQCLAVTSDRIQMGHAGCVVGFFECTELQRRRAFRGSLKRGQHRVLCGLSQSWS